MNRRILSNITPLAETGGLSKNYLFKQQQEVTTHQSEVQQLEQELQRLQFARQEAETKVQNT